ncbi:MAG: TetR family transcriptional regulator [Lachnospiraceae bacterium]|nr:TetR family transcriptional regulator [Lachnospiraceae bacterium]
MAYHHGNLKQALIEAGIDMMNEGGEDAISLRKIANRCGVSSAAP